MVSSSSVTQNFVISMADLPKGATRTIDLEFSDAMLDNAKQALDIADLRKTRIKGELRPEGHKNWLLRLHVGASATQSCVVTLAPVKTRIETDLRRLFLTDWQEPEGDSVVEMTEDADAEPLGAEIDLEQIALEAIAMALPDYPRVEGAEVETHVFAAPGIAPMTDQDAKPFAGLAALKDKMGQ